MTGFSVDRMNEFELKMVRCAAFDMRYSGWELYFFVVAFPGLPYSNVEKFLAHII